MGAAVTAAVVASLCTFSETEPASGLRLFYRPSSINVVSNVWRDVKITIVPPTYLIVISQPNRRKGSYRIIEPEAPSTKGRRWLPGPCLSLG